VRVREGLAENCVTLDSHDGERGSSRSLCGSVYTGLLSRDIPMQKLKIVVQCSHLWKG
jgi:hypothetical protein